MAYSGKSNKSHSNNVNNKILSALVEFTSGMKTELTRKNYMMFIRQFHDYCEAKTYDSILPIKPDEVKRFLESFVTYNRNEGLAKNNINSKICAIKLFYEMNDMEVSFTNDKSLYVAM